MRTASGCLQGNLPAKAMLSTAKFRAGRRSVESLPLRQEKTVHRKVVGIFLTKDRKPDIPPPGNIMTFERSYPPFDVVRQGRGGNLIEETGPELFISFNSDDVVQAVFRGEYLLCRYMELRRVPGGFGPEDKFWIRSIPEKEIETMGKLNLELDPGGDLYLSLSTVADEGLEDAPRRGKYPMLNVAEISQMPERFLRRGIDTVILNGLSRIKEERQARQLFGTSQVDPEWNYNNYDKNRLGFWY